MEKKQMTIVIAAVVVVAIVAIAAFAIMNNGNGGSGGDADNGARVGEEVPRAKLPNEDSRLWVYGNANEDDYMDKTDLTVLKEMVNGNRAATQLADANADGKIDDNDVKYLEKILAATSSTEMDVYYVDNYFLVAKVSWPVKSIATGYCSGLYVAETTGLTPKITMIDTYWKYLNPYTQKAKLTGSTDAPNYEAIIGGNVDVYVPGYCDAKADPLSRTSLNPVGIDTMFINTCDNSGLQDYPNEYIDRSIVMFGYLLQGDMEQTYKYLEWHDKVLKSVEDFAKTISDEKAWIMSRHAPSYRTGTFNITGPNNTNLIHAEWAGCYCIGDHSATINKNYTPLTLEQILAVLKQDAYDKGYTEVYWMDNEHDGFRHQYDLDETVKSWHDALTEASPTMYYMGMAREAGNSPLYIIELVFYQQFMYGYTEYDYEDLFEYWVDNFTYSPEIYKANMDIGDFYKFYGTMDD